MTSERINNLPINGGYPTQQDLRVMEAMFGAQNNTSEASKLIVPGILFLVLGLPFVDKFLKGFITTSDFVFLIIKTGIFLGLLLIAQLFGLA